MSLSTKEISERIKLGAQRGVAKALAEHKRASRPIHIARHGKIIEIPPEKIKVPPEEKFDK